MIDPRHLTKNILPPPVTVEALKADGQTFTAPSGLRLRPRTRNLQFEYTALSLTAPERVQFRYKLEGYDNDWRGPTSVRQVTYTNLPPRDYVFRVIASNNDGVWNETGASANFTILPAFYQTGWFLLLCAAAAAFLILASYRWRIRQVTARLDLRFQERLGERTRIARDLHDTLLQAFLSASMQLHVANNKLSAESPAKPLVVGALDLMRQVIDEGRNAVRSLRLSGLESDDLEQAFSRIPKELTVPQSVDFRVMVEGQVRPLHPAIRDELYLVGREALTNAFRHSQASAIEVELEYSESQLRVVVRDNGCGVDEQILRSGRDGHWGLSGMRERAGRIGSRLKVWSRVPGGTEVELSVPGQVAFRSHSSNRGPRWLDRLRPAKGQPENQKDGNERL